LHFERNKKNIVTLIILLTTEILKIDVQPLKIFASETINQRSNQVGGDSAQRDWPI